MSSNAKTFIYVVARDLGFAPNPFHGMCTLATCKPKIRNSAKIGDWIIGVGGRALKATGHCVFAMKVTKKVTFNEYWNSEEFNNKKPVRNGSMKMMLGDNIYVQSTDKSWQQAHSHHSLEDGSINIHNLKRDTSSNFVLISEYFYYFGCLAPLIPSYILSELNYKNHRNHRTYSINESAKLISWLETDNVGRINKVLADPFNFNQSSAHYSVKDDRIFIPK
jgi:hypothetical protein